MSTLENKSYLSAGISALSPWNSRAASPKHPTSQGFESDDANSDAAIKAQRGGDHAINRRHRLSLRHYTRDCPPLAVRWFHAIDVPKRKPFSERPVPSEKPLPNPKKWVTFSVGDSRAIELSFQRLADEDEAAEQRRDVTGSPLPPGLSPGSPRQDSQTKVPVNEDFLFDVDIEKRELCPAYWLGPVYDVRRGTWFYTDGIPCDENLATQLEEGYLKTRPWRFARQEPRAPSKPRSRPASMTLKGGEPTRRLRGHSKSNPLTPRASAEDLKDHAVADRAGDASPKLPPEEPTNAYRLFGAHMNSVVTYQDELTAWLLTDDFLSRMSSTLYQRFAGGGHFAGVKLIRGFVDLSKKRSEKDADRPDAPAPASSREGGADRRADSDKEDATSDDDSSGTQSPSRARIKTFERHMSSLVGSGPEDLEKREEEIRKRDEKEMREDYKDTADEQGREIEHLIFVTHGIGQRLGMRMESVNFIHDVNTLRKSLKSVYAKSADLQALNCEVETMPKNCRVQVLPICWRHLLDFPKQSLKHNRREHDLGDVNFEDHEYPNLDDITVEGVPAVRNLLTDLALDILLYQSPAYKGHISRVVFQECNRIYRLFRERNPSFNGKVSLIGHSLGSAIMFDLLCQQRASTTQASKRRATADRVQLDFEVEDFYALGSPIGLFQMLKGRMITARPPSDFASLRSSSDSTDGSLSQAGTGGSAARELEITTSSPKCKQMFNIFHPTDPISYRLEPLISPAMSSLKPQPLPYTKKGIFGAPVGQGLTGIGARVGQGVSGFWSSLSSGIASGILNRSLGITGTDAAKHSSDLSLPQKSSRPLSVGAVPAAGGEPGMAFYNEERKRRLAEEPIAPGDVGEHPPTLLDAEIETLFAGFQKQTKGQQTKGQQASTNRAADEDLQWQELEDRSRKLRREEAKVRALNANGRVDYSIQEGAFDISLLASIASHLSYWADEDVSHFMISQLLARHRVFKKEDGVASDVRS